MGILALLAATAFGDAAGPTAGYSVQRDLVYASPGGKDLLLDAYLPAGDGPFPAVLVVHGGAWRIGSKGQLAFYARALADRGYAAFAINYRLAPQYPFPAQIEDCRSAVRWVRQNAERFKIDPNRIGGIGYSAGGHLVALLGVTGKIGENGDTRLQAVCAGGAPCDFRPLPEDWRGLAFWLGGSRAEKPDAYEAASPAAHITDDAPPMFFFHGSEDLLVPDESPQQMVEALKAAGCQAELCLVENGGHLSTMWSTQELEQAIQFLDRHLQDPPAGEGPVAAE